jgi:hypothetical protein
VRRREEGRGEDVRRREKRRGGEGGDEEKREEEAWRKNAARTRGQNCKSFLVYELGLQRELQYA